MNQETMKYKDYTATIDWSDEENCYTSDVIGIRHIITFGADTLPELYETFKEMIDWYLAECKEDGIEPNKPPTEIMIPFPTELYAQAYRKAENADIPVQTFMHEAVQQSAS